MKKASARGDRYRGFSKRHEQLWEAVMPTTIPLFSNTRSSWIPIHRLYLWSKESPWRWF